SLILRGVEMAVSGLRMRQEDINHNILTAEHSGDWKSHPGIGATISGVMTASDEFSGNNSGKILEVSWPFKDHRRTGVTNEIEIKGTDGQGSVRTRHTFQRKVCRVIRLELNHELRDEIPLDTPNQTETTLLRQLFGEKYSHQGFKSLDDIARIECIESANDKLSKLVADVLPSTYPIQIQIRELPNGNLALLLRDEVNARTRWTSRGTGLRVMLDTCIRLLPFSNTEQDLIILVDEPEQHLHADAQHRLRRFF
ncbi:MAG: hypothetical protein AAF593_01450, partial [Planctomycetota bacterium]